MLAGEAYRFECRGSFGGIVTVSIVRRGSRVELAAKFGRHFTPEHEVRKPLSAADWDRLQAALSLADFWALPEFGTALGLDGSGWTIEGRRGKAAHCVNRWEPPPGAYRDLGLFFVDLAGLEWPGDLP